MIRRWLTGLALLAGATAVGLGIPEVNPTTAGFGYLVCVLAVAARGGLAEAIAVSVAAMLCFNYFFLPPVGRLTIADPQNWVALFAFLATALVASHLSNRARRQTAEARERQRETEQLYALSRAILLTEAGAPEGREAARQIARIFEASAVVFYDARTGELHAGGPEDLPDMEPRLRQVALDGSLVREPGLVLAPIALGGQPVGALALRGTALSDAARQALVNLVAIALERARTREAASRAEVARQSEEFKSTLLDAIAHEFKTPLTSIKAAATALIGESAGGPQGELATIIDEEADRLSLLVTEAVRMAQIDAGKLRVERGPVRLEALWERIGRHFASRLDGRELRLPEEAGLPAVDIDLELTALALRQLIDNGLKYGRGAIEVTARAAEGHVELAVRDHGPGIPARERERVFEPFYRRAASRERIPGSGMGLHIAREILEAEGGAVWIEETAGEGTTVRVRLPEAARE